MTRAEKAKPRGRERSIGQTMVLELIAERETVTLHEVADTLRMPHPLAYCNLDRLQEQKLVVLVESGARGKESHPSVWQIREAFERRREDHQQTEFDD